jgi:hypothetical protein
MNLYYRATLRTYNKSLYSESSWHLIRRRMTSCLRTISWHLKVHSPVNRSNRISIIVGSETFSTIIGQLVTDDVVQSLRMILISDRRACARQFKDFFGIVHGRSAVHRTTARDATWCLCYDSPSTRILYQSDVEWWPALYYLIADVCSVHTLRHKWSLLLW